MAGTDWNKLRVVDLKKELQDRSLVATGLKADLVQRLQEWEESQASGEQSSAAADVASQPAPEQATQAQAQEPTAIQPSIEKSASESAAEGTAPLDAKPPPEQATGNDDIEVANIGGTGSVTAGVDHEHALGSQPGEIAAETGANGVSQPVTEAGKVSLDQQVPEDTNQTLMSAEPDSGLTATNDTAINSVSQAIEVLQDAQKRKRRSKSPAPATDDEASASKRARTDNHTSNQDEDAKMEDIEDVGGPIGDEKNNAPGVNGRHGQNETNSQELPTALDTDHPVEDQIVSHEEDSVLAPPSESVQKHPEALGTAIEDDQEVEPAVHPATCALYIKNLTRPLKPSSLEDHVLDLATPHGRSIDASTIRKFYLDSIKTHAFVLITSISTASRARTGLHNKLWPNEPQRKAIWVDYIPENKFFDWVAAEEATVRNKNLVPKWEVEYQGFDASITAMHKQIDQDDGNAAGRRPSAPAVAPIIPTGPRGFEGVPTGPRAGLHPSRMGLISGDNYSAPGNNFGPGYRSGAAMDDLATLTTRAYPPIKYKPVDRELAANRLRSIRQNELPMRSRPKNYDPKMNNRYSFERVDVFVDRGIERFDGIRPPHREAERRRAAGLPPLPGLPPTGSSYGRSRGGGGGGDRRERGPRRRDFDRGPPPRPADDPYSYRPAPRDRNRSRDRSRGRKDRRDRRDRSRSRDRYRDRSRNRGYNDRR